MSQPALDNRTEFAVAPRLLMGRDGEMLVTMVKASFEAVQGHDGPDIPLELAPPERTRGLRPADIPWGEPEVSSIAYPSDHCVHKPGTDVIVVGKAYAPGGPQPTFDARVEVGPVAKSIRLFGPRIYRDNGQGTTSPQPVPEVELRYELAYGGFDDSDPEQVVEEARNPIGMGCVRDKTSLTHAAAPQIEDPSALLSDLDVQPAPAGLGAIGRHWAPRRNFAGTYDDTWQKTRAPLMPSDFDDRFNRCAAEGLWSSTPLRGDEAVSLANLLPGGRAWRFSLPLVRLQITVAIPGRELENRRPSLDTVLIDLLETSLDKPPAVEMVWRLAVPAPRRLGDARIVVREVTA